MRLMHTDVQLTTSANYDAATVHIRNSLQRSVQRNRIELNSNEMKRERNEIN